jgi:AraC-like DNA-binding protein
LDVLSAVLRELRLESVAYHRLELHAPWRIVFDQPGVRGVHVVMRGRCELVLKGAPPLLLEPGDLMLATRGDAHVLCSEGGRRAPAVSAADLPRSDDGGHIRVGGGGAETVVLCGAFFFREEDHPALSALPRVLHVPSQSGRAPHWLAGYIDALSAEVFESGPGSELVMARLSDALVARALRFHLEQEAEPGWLRGLNDPYIAKSLSAMHDDLRRAWTLPALARVAGLSRAAFAARFAEKVGQTPMRYLLQCRMRRAMSMLSREQATLAKVADSVGYGSEAALSAAFKRVAGVAPGAYGRSARRVTSGPDVG